MIDVFQGIKEVLREMEVDGDIRPASNLVLDLDLDSLEMAEFGIALEEKFSVTIPDQEMDRVLTVGDAVDCIRHLTEKTS